MAVDVGPGTFVQPEIVQAWLAEGSGVLLEFLVEGAVAAPELLHEERVEDLGCLDQFGQGAAVARGERGLIVFHVDGRETRVHFLELG